MISGILVVNKEKGMTSRDVVNCVSRIIGTKKIGHTGTLDPLATGVLVLTIGNCTKLSELITAYEKEYIATVKLGISTDTLDITGNVLEQKDYKIDKGKIIKVLSSFIGEYSQTVPLYSAIKINGKKLYEYARNNEKIDLPSRLVSIFDIELISIDATGFKFKCKVSKGTYIRSLIRDICDKLNTIGVMSDLVRTKQGDINIDNSYTIEDIKNSNYKLISIEDLLKNVYEVKLDDELLFKVRNGQKLIDIYNMDLIKFTYNDEIIAIYKLENGVLKLYKMINLL